MDADVIASGGAQRWCATRACSRARCALQDARREGLAIFVLSWTARPPKPRRSRCRAKVSTCARSSACRVRCGVPQLAAECVLGGSRRFTRVVERTATPALMAELMRTTASQPPLLPPRHRRWLRRCTAPAMRLRRPPPQRFFSALPTHYSRCSRPPRRRRARARAARRCCQCGAVRPLGHCPRRSSA